MSILSRKFISRLPDKGEKITNMVKRLESILAHREHVDQTADIFQKMALGAERTSRARNMADSDNEESENDPLRQIVNKPYADKVVKDERTFVNSYEQVMARREVMKVTNKAKFLPNR